MLKYVPTIPTEPPTVKIIKARCEYPSRRNDNKAGTMNAMIVPEAHPTKSKTSPRFGAAIARLVHINHNDSVKKM